MNAKEVKIWLSSLKGELLFMDCTLSDEERYADALNAAMSAIDTLTAYHWHDLKHDPKDLPDSNRPVMVKALMHCKWDDKYRVFQIVMTYKHKIMYGKPIGWGVSYPYDFNFESDEVIAWRELDGD